MFCFFSDPFHFMGFGFEWNDGLECGRIQAVSLDDALVVFLEVVLVLGERDLCNLLDLRGACNL